jgi:hypothetical protein
LWKGKAGRRRREVIRMVEVRHARRRDYHADSCEVEICEGK